MTCWAGLRLLGDLGDEILGDLDVDVGLQKGDAHLAHGLADLKFGEPPALGEFGEYVVETLGK